MGEELNITSQLLDITKTLAEKNVNFSIRSKFTIKDKEFKFDASSSKKDTDNPVLPKKRKKTCPSQKASNLKRFLECKEKNSQSGLTTSPMTLKILLMLLQPEKMAMSKLQCLVISVNIQPRQKMLWNNIKETA